MRKSFTKEENLSWNLKTLTKCIMEEKRKLCTKAQSMKGPRRNLILLEERADRLSVER